MLLSTCLLFKFLFMLRDINSQDINSDPSKSSYLFMQSLLVTISEFNEGVTYFQLRVLRIIFFILVHLSISEITGDIDFTFVYKGFYHKNICMNPQCKDREITNNYFTCCDIFHLFCGRSWQQFVLQMGLFLIIWNLDRVQSPPALHWLSLPHQASLPALVLRQCPPLEFQGRLGSTLCILRNRYYPGIV